VSELEARGFVNPTLEYDIDTTVLGDLYSVNVGVDCRISVTAPYEDLRYWSYGGLIDVSASTIEANAEALGLKHCFTE